ncbi:protein ripply1 [Lissotriton helveticus]
MELICAKPPVGTPGQRCPVYSRPAQEHRVSSALFWRPWLITASDSPSQRRKKQLCPYSRPSDGDCAQDNKELPLFNHPVRLFWPKSKTFDYLYHNGEMMLKNFPVQATINFYEESDSEDEDWDEEEAEEDEAVELVSESKLSTLTGVAQGTSFACHSSTTYRCLN